MSIKTTKYITRQEAEAKALQALAEQMAQVGSISNGALGDLLDTLLNESDPFSNWIIAEDL